MSGRGMRLEARGCVTGLPRYVRGEFRPEAEDDDEEAATLCARIDAPAFIPSGGCKALHRSSVGEFVCVVAGMNERLGPWRHA